MKGSDAVWCGNGLERHFDAGMNTVPMLVQVDFQDPIIVDSERLAEGILRDLEPAIYVPAQRRGEIEVNGERERVRTKGSKQVIAVGATCKGNQNLSSCQHLIASTRGRKDAPTIHCGVLVVDAGWDRQGHGQPVSWNGNRN